MGLYKVLHSIQKKGKIYKSGETVELDEETALKIPKIVLAIPDSLESVAQDEFGEEIPVQKKPTNKPNKGVKS